MPRYVAFLRGVMPTNCPMPALKASFESAGFHNVKTVLGSGNVAFDAEESSDGMIETRAEEAMLATLGRSFYTIVRRQDALRALLDRDRPPGVAASSKQVVTFFRDPPTARVALPLSEHGASLYLLDGREAFSAYEPSPKGPVFMTLIERAFGKEVTTRTLDTVRKCAAA